MLEEEQKHSHTTSQCSSTFVSGGSGRETGVIYAVLEGERINTEAFGQCRTSDAVVMLQRCTLATNYSRGHDGTRKAFCSTIFYQSCCSIFIRSALNRRRMATLD